MRSSAKVLVTRRTSAGGDGARRSRESGTWPQILVGIVWKVLRLTTPSHLLYRHHHFHQRLPPFQPPPKVVSSSSVSAQHPHRWGRLLDCRGTCRRIRTARKSVTSPPHHYPRSSQCATRTKNSRTLLDCWTSSGRRTKRLRKPRMPSRARSSRSPRRYSRRYVHLRHRAHRIMS